MFLKYGVINDIALVVTKEKIGRGERRKKPYMPICLPGKHLAFETGMGVVGGWGSKQDEETRNNAYKCTFGFDGQNFKLLRDKKAQQLRRYLDDPILKAKAQEPFFEGSMWSSLLQTF